MDFAFFAIITYHHYFQNEKQKYIFSIILCECDLWRNPEKSNLKLFIVLHTSLNNQQLKNKQLKP